MGFSSGAWEGRRVAALLVGSSNLKNVVDGVVQL